MIYRLCIPLKIWHVHKSHNVSKNKLRKWNFVLKVSKHYSFIPLKAFCHLIMQKVKVHYSPHTRGYNFNDHRHPKLTLWEWNVIYFLTRESMSRYRWPLTCCLRRVQKFFYRTLRKGGHKQYAVTSPYNKNKLLIFLILSIY